jgi:hypothetical protein
MCSTFWLLPDYFLNRHSKGDLEGFLNHCGKNAVVAQLSKLAILYIIFKNQAGSLGYF